MAIDPSTAFVSYSREDWEFALRLAKDLKSKRALTPKSALLIAGIVGAILIVGWLIYRGSSSSSATPGAAPSSSSTTPGAVSLTLRGHTDSVIGVAYSPDGKRLATASADKTAKVWDVEQPGSN